MVDEDNHNRIGVPPGSTVLTGYDFFSLGYLCGWAQGWGWAISPWVLEKAKRLIYLRRTVELLNAFDGSEPDGLFELWNEMNLVEVDMYVSSSCEEAEDGDRL